MPNSLEFDSVKVELWYHDTNRTCGVADPESSHGAEYSEAKGRISAEPGRNLSLYVSVGRGFQWKNQQQGLCVNISMQREFKGTWFLRQKDVRTAEYEIKESALFTGSGGAMQKAPLTFREWTPGMS